MSKKPAKSVRSKSDVKPPRPVKPEKRPVVAKTSRMMVLFGIDENKRPRAARFNVHENLGLLAKAADAMDLVICEVKTPALSDLAMKLPAGQVHANGAGFVPYIRQDFYDKLVAAAGPDGEPPSTAPAATSSPRTFEDIATGHLVIAQEDLETGWWEAIVFACDGDELTLRYRDYPRLPKFTRPRTAVALVSPQAYPPSEQKA